jgi:hypothetical protein
MAEHGAAKLPNDFGYNASLAARRVRSSPLRGRDPSLAGGARLCAIRGDGP